MRYLVFARRSQEQPIEHRGDLDVDPALAAAAARERFGEDWVELSLVPEPGAHWAIGVRAETANV